MPGESGAIRGAAPRGILRWFLRLPTRLAEVESRLGSMSHDEFIAGIQWAVVAADNGHTEALLAVLDPYAPGTEEHVRVMSGYFFERPELLAAIGEAANADRLTLTLELPGGEALTRTLPGRQGESTARSDDARRLLDGLGLPPLYLREPGQSIFMAWLPESDEL